MNNYKRNNKAINLTLFFDDRFICGKHILYIWMIFMDIK